MLVAPWGRLKAEPVTGPGYLFQVNKGRIQEHSRVGAEGHMERRQGAGSCQLCLEPQPPHPLKGLAQGLSRTYVPQAPSVGITSQVGQPQDGGTASLKPIRQGTELHPPSWGNGSHSRPWLSHCIHCRPGLSCLSTPRENPICQATHLPLYVSDFCTHYQKQPFNGWSTHKHHNPSPAPILPTPCHRPRPLKFLVRHPQWGSTLG